MRSSRGVCALRYSLELANIPDRNIKSNMIYKIDRL